MTDDSPFGPDKPIKPRKSGPSTGRISYMDLYGDPDKKLTDEQRARAERPIPSDEERRSRSRYVKEVTLFGAAEPKKKGNKYSASKFRKPFLGHMLDHHGITAGQCTDGQHFDSRTGRSHDFMGFVDYQCAAHGRTINVQVTSKANMNARIKKILAHPKYEVAKGGGQEVLVLGFHKVKNRWVGVEHWL